MKVSAIISERRLAAPLLALVVTSLIGMSLVAIRTVLTGRWNSLYLIWNLILAWVPLVFALSVCRLHRLNQVKSWRFAARAGAWALFFPNAPYILTDLIHLTSRHRQTFWTDLVLILLFAFTGLILGFLSLYLLQSVIAQRLGRLAGWLFVAIAAGLASVGIYIGRFLRWNSWDVLVNPLRLTHDVGSWATGLLANRHDALFPVLLATFLFLAYAMLYALTHLNPVEPTPVSVESRSVSV